MGTEQTTDHWPKEEGGSLLGHWERQLGVGELIERIPLIENWPQGIQLFFCAVPIDFRLFRNHEGICTYLWRFSSQ